MARLFSRPLLAVFLVPMVSGASLTKHKHHAANDRKASVEAAADQDAQAVIDAAEQGSTEPAIEGPQAAQLSVAASDAKDKEVAKGDEDGGDDDDDDDDEKSSGAPGSIVPIEKNPGEAKTLHVTYGVSDGVLRGESLTPSGRLTKARQRLQDNLYQQTKINSLIWQMQNETSFQGQVDAESQALATETQAKALAAMLGGMRKEMRKFASPFFLDHLYSERKRLKAAELELQAELDCAEGAMGGGHQGWPHPGEKVVVAESVYRKPVSLRGSDPDDEVKELKVSVAANKEDASLAQLKSKPSADSAKSAAAATFRLGAVTLVATGYIFTL